MLEKIHCYYVSRFLTLYYDGEVRVLTSYSIETKVETESNFIRVVDNSNGTLYFIMIWNREMKVGVMEMGKNEMELYGFILVRGGITRLVWMSH